MNNDSHSLEHLLDLDGFIAEVGGGFWVKIEARRLRASLSKPHGIDYSLTLHSANGQRLLGYDNAHPVRTGRGPAGKRQAPYDHRHRGDAVKSYVYESAEKLLEQFWADVDRILRESGVL